MALRSESKELCGHTWQVTTMGAEEGWDVLSELSATLLPVIGKASGALGATMDIMDMDLSALGDAADELAKQLRDPNVRKLVRRLATTNVHCDGAEVKDKPDSYGLIFAGEYSMLLQVAACSVEVNFNLPLLSWLSAIKSALASKPTPLQTTDSTLEE